MPADWREYLFAQSFCDLALLPLQHSCPPNSKIPPPSLTDFLRDVSTLEFPRQPEGIQRLTDVDAAFTGSAKAARNRKKAHEVRELTKLICGVARSAGCERVLDVGCGQGSLDLALAEGGDLDVVGIEAQAGMVAAAAARAATSRGKVRLARRAIAADSSAPAVVESLLAEAWADKPTAAPAPILLCGLHSCGDLSPTMIRCFVASERCTALVVVPCLSQGCY